MKTRITVLLSLLVLAITATTACKKSSDNANPATEIIGTWNVTKVYVDSNNNGMMDANEQSSTSLFSNSTLKFNTDNTVAATIFGQSLTGTWQLLDNNTYVQIALTGAFGSTTSFHIESLSSTAAEVKDTTDAANGGTTWLYLNK